MTDRDKITHTIDGRDYEFSAGLGAQLECRDEAAGDVEHGDVRCVRGVLVTPCTIRRGMRRDSVSWGIVGLGHASIDDCKDAIAELKKRIFS